MCVVWCGVCMCVCGVSGVCDDTRGVYAVTSGGGERECVCVCVRACVRVCVVAFWEPLNCV